MAAATRMKQILRSFRSKAARCSWIPLSSTTLKSKLIMCCGLIELWKIHTAVHQTVQIKSRLLASVTDTHPRIIITIHEILLPLDSGDTKAVKWPLLCRS